MSNPAPRCLAFVLSLIILGAGMAPNATAAAAFEAAPAWTTSFGQGMPAPMIGNLRRLLDTPLGYLTTNQTPALSQIHSVDPQSPVARGLFGLLMRRLPIGFDHELDTAVSSADPLLIQRALDALAQAHRDVQPDVAAAVKARLAELSKSAEAMTPEQLEAEAAKISGPLGFFGGEAALQGAAISQLAKDRREGRIGASERQIAQALAPAAPIETPLPAPAPAPVKEELIPAPAASPIPVVAAPAPVEAPPALAPSAPVRESLTSDAAMARVRKFGERLDNSEDSYDSLKLVGKLAGLLSISPVDDVHAAIFDHLLGQVSENNDSAYSEDLGPILVKAAAATPLAALRQKTIEALVAAATDSSDYDDAGKFIPTAAAIAAASPEGAVKELAVDKLLSQLKDSSDESYSELVAEQVGRVIESMSSAFKLDGPASAANGRLVDALIDKLGSADDYDGERKTVRALAAAARRDPSALATVASALAKQISDSGDDDYTKDVIWELESLAQGPYERAAQLQVNEKLVDALIDKLGSAESYDGERDLVRALVAAAGRDGGQAVQLRAGQKLVSELTGTEDDEFARDVADALGNLATGSQSSAVQQAAVEGIMQAAKDNSDADYARRFVTNVGPIALASQDAAVKDRAAALLTEQLKDAEDDAYIDELKDQVEMITGKEPVVERPADEEEQAAEPAAQPATTAPHEASPSAETPRAKRQGNVLTKALMLAFRIFAALALIRAVLAVIHSLLN